MKTNQCRDEDDCPRAKELRKIGWLSRLVRLLLTPTWKLRIRSQMEHAQKQYDDAVAAYHEAEAECRSSFYEHNQASYWKGRRDALRVFLPNAIGEARREGTPPQ